MAISIRSFFFAFSGFTRRTQARGQVQAQATPAEIASAKLDAILTSHDPHHMNRNQAYAMMREMEQAGLLPQGRNARDMTALHRPGESIGTIDMDAKFDIVEAVRANYAQVERSGTIDARSAAFVKAQYDFWNMLAEKSAASA